MFQPFSNPYNKKDCYCIDCWDIIPDHIPQEQWKQWLNLRKPGMI